MKPRIFISAVSAEFMSARDKVAHVIEFLGYEAERQEIFGTEPGDLREMLRQKIDSCEGLVQIIGCGYGAEPPTVDPDMGRVSYTQFEFLYAKQKGKRTWLLFAGDQCRRDNAPSALDMPRNVSHPDPNGTELRAIWDQNRRRFSSQTELNSVPFHPDPKSYQAERKALQEAYREQLRSSGHIRWNFTSDIELENAVLKLRNDSEALRQKFQDWQQRIASGLTILEKRFKTEQKLSRATVLRVAAGICLLGVFGCWGVYSLIRQQNSDLEAKLKLLIEQSKVIVAKRWLGLQGADAELKYLALSKGSGFQIDEIKHLIQDGLSSSDPIVVAMAQYLAGESSKALATTSAAIREETANAQHPVSRLAEFHIVSALSNLDIANNELAIQEFEKAWTAYGVIGNHADERDTMVIAAAVLFCSGDTEIIIDACAIMSRALSLGSSSMQHLDPFQILMLYASPGIFSDTDNEKGCLNLTSVSDTDPTTLVKTLTIGGGNSTLSRWKKTGIVETDPVGFVTMPTGILRHSKAPFRDAIRMVRTSQFLGEQHPYLMILYLNCADIAWGLADDQLMAEMASNIVQLSQRHVGRSETLSLVRRILRHPGAQLILSRLEAGGFIAKGDVNPAYPAK